ncbi:dUTP diphosphatase [Halarsenatibacter silvermanii]|uniref:Deoxyuridine 5'-triphosphate nucleotidohydrolase n=1 Tax=Halarsenatibacter silvermanii TaxID=321763 RepID=A0A1G9LJR5_9FIRM|nr:dUTP diphosphatase [Halarsenatibacter silvermanii]SDL61755.1 deoxyuridine 5'-triphosphate nucleotidohydrolase [Halarsenatibacter silvermanii]
MKIEIKRLDDEIPLPDYQHAGDAGMDIYSAESKTLAPGERGLVMTGLKVAVPEYHAGFVYPRSGLALDEGVTVLNADGVIDPGYRGEVGVLLINHGQSEFEIKKGDRIAQLIVQKVEEVEWKEVEKLSRSERGEGGFGHTGKN